MTDHPFRFGAVAGHATDAGAWTGLARRAESLGYSTLLVPDTLGTLSPFVAAAVAVVAERAIVRAVLEATSVAGIPSYRDVFPSAHA